MMLKITSKVLIGAVKVGTLAILFMYQLAVAGPIATIDGNYDITSSDNPALIFHNTSLFDLTNVQIVLHGYQGVNNGITQTVSLPNILAMTNYTDIWGGAAPNTLIPGSLISYDYDDEYGGTSHTIINPGCTVGAYSCAYTGNFDVTFTAMWNGKSA